MGTEPAGLAEGHRGVDAESARLVARGADDAAIAGPAPTDDDRLAEELRAIALLDRREERVEIDVQDGPLVHRAIIARPASPRAGASIGIRPNHAKCSRGDP
jgi:hypothetical protein